MDERKAFEEKLENLLIDAIRLAIVRWDLHDADGELMTDECCRELAQDTAWAVQGEGTCDEEPIAEWKSVMEAWLARAASPQPQKLPCYEEDYKTIHRGGCGECELRWVWVGAASPRPRPVGESK